MEDTQPLLQELVSPRVQHLQTVLYYELLLDGKTDEEARAAVEERSRHNAAKKRPFLFVQPGQEPRQKHPRLAKSIARPKAKCGRPAEPALDSSRAESSTAFAESTGLASDVLSETSDVPLHAESVQDVEENNEDDLQSGELSRPLQNYHCRLFSSELKPLFLAR